MYIYVGSYLHRLTSNICTDLRKVTFVQTYERSLFVHTYRSYLYRLICHICINLRVTVTQQLCHICTYLCGVTFVQTYEGSYLYRFMRDHIWIDLQVVFVQTYEGSYLHRLMSHICTDLRGVISVDLHAVIFVQTNEGSYLYRHTCHICRRMCHIWINLRVIFTPQFSILNSIDIFDIKSPRIHGVTQWFHYIIIFLPCRV